MVVEILTASGQLRDNMGRQKKNKNAAKAMTLNSFNEFEVLEGMVLACVGG